MRTRALVLPLALAAALASIPGASHAGGTTQLFTFTGVTETFVVPAGVTEIFIAAVGAAGGRPTAFGGVASGTGGVAQGFLDVTPGEVLEVRVGGQGCSDPPGPDCGGFNGGGEAPSDSRGGGGGASDVRQGGSGFDDRVIVAGGGGGACGGVDFPGGNAGGEVGQPGGVSQPGLGGTQSAGGLGYMTATGLCLDGGFGLGGDAGTGTCAGGGGGWYGGGSGCGGGGGSSYIGGVSNGATVAGDAAGNGAVSFSWSGGGIAEVEIDIRPDGPNNLINTGVADKIDVAILGSAIFDVADIDLSSLAFGPAAAAPFLWAGTTVEDIDADSFDDLVVFFRQEESGIIEGDTEACVTGELTDATVFQGCDAITAMACGIGFELAFLLPPIAWLRARHRRLAGVTPGRGRAGRRVASSGLKGASRGSRLPS